MKPSLRPIAAKLIVDLAAARGDHAAETAALQSAVDACTAACRAAGDDEPYMIPEQFAEDAYEGQASVLESVPEATEDEVFRWREQLADLCGY